MTSHDLKTPEPVVSAQTVTILVGVVAAGLGYTLNDTMVTAIAGGVWLVISILATLVARSRVTPLAGGWQQQVLQIVEQSMDDTASRIVNQLYPGLTSPTAPQPQQQQQQQPPPPSSQQQPAAAFGLGRIGQPPPDQDPTTAALPRQS